MSKFTNSYMTNAGKKLMFGGGQVTYTRAALFTQDVSAMSVDAIRKLDALDGQILSANVGIASQRPQDNGNSTIKVEATFSNAGQKQDAKFASVGWFAKTVSTSETLIAVCEVEGGILGAGDPSGASTASINASVNITIGDSTTVTALIDPSGTVTKTVLDSELAKKDDTTDVDAKIANLKGTVDAKADKATVDAEIGKIDFTPYAKTADVNSALAKKDDTTDVDAKLSRKADSTAVTNLVNDAKNTVESKADALQKEADTANADRQSLHTAVTTLDSQAVKSVKGIKPDSSGDVALQFIHEYSSPQEALDASKTLDGVAIYDMNNEPSEAVIGDQKINIEWLYNAIQSMQSTITSQQSAISSLQSTVDSQKTTIQSQTQTINSLSAQLTNANNEIAYIKANYIEGKRFTADQETDAETWENSNSQRIAFVEGKQ